MIWGPDVVVANACAIARDLAQRSRLSEEELLAAILEPFGIGFVDPDPSDGGASEPERTTIRGCDAISTIADPARGVIRDVLGS